MNSDPKRRTARSDQGGFYPSPLLLTHLPASRLVLLSSCFVLSACGFMPTMCTGCHWCQTRRGETQVQLNHRAAWLRSGRNHKTPRRGWVIPSHWFITNYALSITSLFQLPQPPAASWLMQLHRCKWKHHLTCRKAITKEDLSRFSDSKVNL